MDINPSRILDSQLPTGLIKRPNPLFERQFKRLPWPPSGRMTRTYTPISKMTLLRRYTIIGCLLPFVLIVPFAASSYSWVGFLGFSSFITSAFGLLVDIYYAMTAINNIIPQINGGQWELLRLTNMTEEDILLANYAAIQVRVWRATVIETALRIFAGLTSAIYLGYMLTRYNNNASYFGTLIVVQSLAATVVYVFEPMWRMRAITLLAMTVATWISEYGTAVFVTFAGVLGVLVGEFIVTTVLSIALSVASTLSYANAALAPGGILAIIFALVHVVVLIGGLYIFFRRVNAATFKRLQRVAFHE